MNSFDGPLSLILVCGLPVSGKSTLAERISQKLGLPILSVDPIESAIIKSGIKKTFETGLAAYLVVQTLADEQLKLGHSVLIDAVNGVEQAKNAWHQISANNGARLLILECTYSDAATHRARVDARVRGMHGLPEVTWDEVESCRREYTNWTEPRLTIDSVHDLDANLTKALNYLANR